MVIMKPDNGPISLSILQLAAIALELDQHQVALYHSDYLFDLAAAFLWPANPTLIKKHDRIAAPTYTKPRLPQYMEFHVQKR
jgi:hypothetical protein